MTDYTESNFMENLKEEFKDKPAAMDLMKVLIEETLINGEEYDENNDEALAKLIDIHQEEDDEDAKEDDKTADETSDFTGDLGFVEVGSDPAISGTFNAKGDRFKSTDGKIYVQDPKSFQWTLEAKAAPAASALEVLAPTIKSYIEEFGPYNLPSNKIDKDEYTFTPDEDGSYTFETSSDKYNLDTGMQITGKNIDETDDDSGENLFSKLQLNLVAGETYTIKIGAPTQQTAPESVEYKIRVSGKGSFKVAAAAAPAAEIKAADETADFTGEPGVIQLSGFPPISGTFNATGDRFKSEDGKTYVQDPNSFQWTLEAKAAPAAEIKAADATKAVVEKVPPSDTTSPTGHRADITNNGTKLEISFSESMSLQGWSVTDTFHWSQGSWSANNPQTPPTWTWSNNDQTLTLVLMKAVYADDGVEFSLQGFTDKAGNPLDFNTVNVTSTWSAPDPYTKEGNITYSPNGMDFYEGITGFFHSSHLTMTTHQFKAVGGTYYGFGGMGGPLTIKPGQIFTFTTTTDSEKKNKWVKDDSAAAAADATKEEAAAPAEVAEIKKVDSIEYTKDGIIFHIPGSFGNGGDDIFLFIANGEPAKNTSKTKTLTVEKGTRYVLRIGGGPVGENVWVLWGSALRERSLEDKVDTLIGVNQSLIQLMKEKLL
jgi:hypothetical protein